MGYLDDLNRFTTKSVVETISGINLTTSLISRIADFLMKFLLTLACFYSITYLLYYNKIIKEFGFSENSIYNFVSLLLSFVLAFSVLYDLRTSLLRFVRRNLFTKILSVIFYNMKYVFFVIFLLSLRPIWYFSLVVKSENTLSENQILFSGVLVISLLITVFWFLISMHVDERKLVLIDNSTNLSDLENLQLLQFGPTTNIYYKERLTFYVHHLEYGLITVLKEESFSQSVIDRLDKWMREK